ncbi:MAG: hypothetical protein AAGA09_05135 [Pseudomonadota bacterium]
MMKIPWLHILILSSASGSLFAWLTILAIVSGMEHWVALIFIGATAKLAVLFAPAAPARSAFVASFLFAIFALAMQAAFLPLYFKNNPSYAAVDLPWGLTPTAYIFLFAPLGGLAAGLLGLATAWLVLTAAKIFWPGWRASP